MVLLEKCLKTLQFIVLYFFVKLFNEIFNKGLYPENWTDSIIHTLHTQKKVTQMVPIITGVFLSQMLVVNCLVLLITAGYKCGLT